MEKVAGRESDRFSALNFFASVPPFSKNVILLASFTKRAQPVAAPEFDLLWAKPNSKNLHEWRKTP
jgi:hypothetical protein